MLRVNTRIILLLYVVQDGHIYFALCGFLLWWPSISIIFLRYVEFSEWLMWVIFNLRQYSILLRFIVAVFHCSVYISSLYFVFHQKSTLVRFCIHHEKYGTNDKFFHTLLHNDIWHTALSLKSCVWEVKLRYSAGFFRSLLMNLNRTKRSANNISYLHKVCSNSKVVTHYIY